MRACRRGFLAVAVVWVLGFFAPCRSAGALEPSEGLTQWGRSAISLVAPAALEAEDPDAGQDGGVWGFRRGQQEVGLLVGYGFEIDADGSNKSAMIKNLEFAMVRARWGIFLTDRVGQGILEGNLELMLEPAFLLSVEPTRRTGLELSVLFRYHFATGTRWVPFVTVGAGVIEENFEVEGRPSAGFNFTPQGGPGVSYLLGRNVAMSLEWRLYHVSNANMDTPNVGLNVGWFLLGASLFF